MIDVKQAEAIVLKEKRKPATEKIPLQEATGRVLAEDIVADRDLPPYDRVTMDGIAINYNAIEKGIKEFTVKGTQAAGDDYIEIDSESECIEIMTGAALPESADTIIRYEDVDIANGIAKLKTDKINRGQNIHKKGSDKREKQILAKAGRIITPAEINTAASVGMAEIVVSKLPRVAIVSTGNELVAIDEQPSKFQIRRSNGYALAFVLQHYKIQADIVHINDDEAALDNVINRLLKNNDVLILSGGVSMGKYDHLPKIFKQLQINELFHKVKQRPGKPFWFGVGHDHKPVFAFPGNPVSAFMCMYRYFVPWLQRSLGLEDSKPLYAVLSEDYSFKPELQYFLQVQLSSDEDGTLIAKPEEGNGSGDFTNLLYTDAFMELPAEQTNFKKGEAYRIWPFKPIT